MNMSEPTSDPKALAFTQDFMKRRGLFQPPEETVNETRYERWPTRWDNKVLGIPSMDVAGEERRSNYMPLGS